MAPKGPITTIAAWPETTIADITTKVGSGATPRGGSETYLDVRIEYALVRSQNVFDRYFDRDGLAYITNEQAEGLQGVVLQRGDILLNITGDGVTFGRACIVPEDVRPACVNQHVSIIRVDPAKANPEYVLSFLTHPDVKPYIESFNAGGSRRAITKGHIESFRFPLPPLHIQRAIGYILSTFDNKIESNNRQVALLDEINLTRVRNFNTSYARASLISIGSLGKVVTGKTPSTRVKDNFGGPVPFITISDLSRQHVIFETERYLTKKGADAVRGSIVPPRSVAMSCIATVGECAIVSQTSITNQQINTLIPDEEKIAAEFAYYQFRLLRPELMAVGGGGSVYTNVSKSRFAAIGIPVPTLELQKTLVVPGSVELIHHLTRQSARLEQTRNGLLPELLSGRIRIPEAAAAIEEPVA